MEGKIEDAYWPAIVTGEIVNQIALLVNLIIKKLVTHSCLLNTAVHEKFVQKVETGFPGVLFSNSFYRHLIELLVVEGGLFVILSIFLNIFVFEFVFWKV